MYKSKWALFFFSLMYLVNACTNFETPSFERLADLKLKAIDSNTLSLTANAWYSNPGLLSGYFTRTEIKVLMENYQLGTIDHTERIKVTAHKKFSIPISIRLDIKNLVHEDKTVLNTAIKGLLTKNMALQFSGTTYFELAGMEWAVPVNCTENVSLSTKKRSLIKSKIKIKVE